MPYPFNIQNSQNPIGGYYAHYGVNAPKLKLRDAKKKKNNLASATQSERESMGYNNGKNF